MKKITVECRRDGVLLKTYKLTVILSRRPRPDPKPEEIENECRSLLTRDRPAFAPLAGITFTQRPAETGAGKAG